MITPTRASIKATIAVLLLSLACISLLSAAVAAGSAAAITYQTEKYTEYQQQLAGGQIQAVTINKRLRSVRITLKDGRHVLAHYKRKEEPTVIAALNAKHVHVTLLTSSEALKELKSKPKHHKLRYIVGGALIVVILIVTVVLLINRKRKRERE
ncbi:MAG: hypothetical protein ACLPUT_03995 [Solirubrobacteraceae bacterium]